jgi:hypothetical protein
MTQFTQSVCFTHQQARTHLHIHSQIHVQSHTQLSTRTNAVTHEYLRKGSHNHTNSQLTRLSRWRRSTVKFQRPIFTHRLQWSATRLATCERRHVNSGVSSSWRRIEESQQTQPPSVANSLRRNARRIRCQRSSAPDG